MRRFLRCSAAGHPGGGTEGCAVLYAGSRIRGMLRGFQQHRSGSGARCHPPNPRRAAGTAVPPAGGAGDGAPAALLPQPGLGGGSAGPPARRAGDGAAFPFLPREASRNAHVSFPAAPCDPGGKGKEPLYKPLPWCRSWGSRFRAGIADPRVLTFHYVRQDIRI